MASLRPPPTPAAKAARYMTLLAAWPAMVSAAKPPDSVTQALALGHSQEVIVEFDARAVNQEAAELGRRLGYRHDQKEVVRLREDRYRQIKEGVRRALPGGEHEIVADYSVLPLSLVRVRTPRALAALASHRDVIGIHRDEVKFPVPHLVPQLDSASQNLVGTRAASLAGLGGAGTTVLVIDTGADYTVSDLGACTAPATPARCRLAKALYVDAANAVVADPNPPSSPSNGHGTNVAAIVAGVASATHVAVINVFGTSGTTSDAKILAAINWGIANQAAYNIRSINLSLGDGQRYTSPCNSGNPYVAAFSSVRVHGMVPVVAAGNEGYTNGISSPACEPDAVSVGAVYAANYGNVGWSNCTDATTAADKVACFSNSAPFLTMLAPGAIIVAGGYSYGGTSQATPFAAATVALLGDAYPTETTAQLVARMTSTGKAVTDPRNSQVKPRLDLTSIAVAFTEATAEVPVLPAWAAALLGGLLLSPRSRFAPTQAGKGRPARTRP